MSFARWIVMCGLTEILVESLQHSQRTGIRYPLLDIKIDTIDLVVLQRPVQWLVVRLILQPTLAPIPPQNSSSTHNNRTPRPTTQPRIRPRRRTPNHHQDLHSTLLQLRRLAPHCIPDRIIQTVVVERDVPRLRIDVQSSEVEVCELCRILHQWEHGELSACRVPEGLNVDLISWGIVCIGADFESRDIRWDCCGESHQEREEREE